MSLTDPPSQDLHADVLIVGAGPAGGVAARRLAAAGLRVIALEQGDWQDKSRYRGSEWDWELTAMRAWSPAVSIRRAPADYPIDGSASDMAVLNFNGVGGGTILYNAIWIRLPEASFRLRSETGLGDDWPVSYAELEPFYARTDAEVGVSGLGGNPAYPPGADPPLPPLPLTSGAMQVARALSRRGWHWWPDTNAILSTPYDGRRPCVQRGTCGSGCNEGAKSSADDTHWRKAVALGARLVTGARVLRITTDANGLANGAEWIDEDGALHFQPADVVLSAANGIGTPRLLLNSASARFPAGLANRSGLVGRRLMMHPLATVTGLFHEPLESWQGHNGSMIQSLQFAGHDPDRGFALGAKWSLHPNGGPVAQALQVLAQQGVGAADYHARFRERFGHGLKWSIMCEDLPDEANRVELASDLADSSGMPGAKIVYRTSENCRRALDFNVAQAGDILRDAGAWSVEANNPAGANAHFMGTARMGDDPDSSVVNRWGMSHDVANLGIIDASIFVTAGSVNPTSTVCALALRAAEHLLDIRKTLPVPARRTMFAAPARRPKPSQPAVAAEAWSISAEERARLKALAALVIPSDKGLPSAGDAGIEGAMLDRILGARPDLAAPLKQAINETRPELPALQALRRENAAACQALLTVIVGGYYQNPLVRAAIGYEGQVARPQKADVYPPYVDEGLLDHLLVST